MNPSSDIDMYRTELDIDLLSRALAVPGVVQGACEALEGVREPAGVLVAQRFAREPALNHGHQGAVAARLERELEGGVEARSIETRLGRGDDDPARAVDHLEHVVVVVERVGRRAERHRPDAA